MLTSSQGNIEEQFFINRLTSRIRAALSSIGSGIFVQTQSNAGRDMISGLPDSVTEPSS